MTLHNNNDAEGRTQRTTLSSTLVRIICVTISFVSLACAFLGFGLTCFLLREFDQGAAPCPYNLTVIVFGAAGALLALSFLLLLFFCKRRKRLTKEALLEDLPQVCGGDEVQYKKKFSGAEEAPLEHPVDGKENVSPASPTEPLPNDTADNYEMTQKSADVSYWIEQQKSTSPAGTSCGFPLETTDGATNHTSDPEDSEGEMTSL